MKQNMASHFTSFSQLVHVTMIERDTACTNRATVIPIQRPCEEHVDLKLICQSIIQEKKNEKIYISMED